MAGPPKDVPASELWQKLASAQRPTTIVDYPAKDGDGRPIAQVAIRVLSVAELHGCRANATRYAREQLPDAKPGEIGYEEIYREDLLAQLLAVACRQPDNVDLPFFPYGPKDVRTRTSDELAVLLSAYNEHARVSGPILNEMTVDEMNAWVKRLQEGARTASPLSFLGSEAKNELILHLVSLLSRSSTDSGSPGSPQESSS